MLIAVIFVVKDWRWLKGNIIWGTFLHIEVFFTVFRWELLILKFKMIIFQKAQVWLRFVFNFYFEVIIAPQEVAQIVKAGPIYSVPSFLQWLHFFF